MAINPAPSNVRVPVMVFLKSAVLPGRTFMCMLSPPVALVSRLLDVSLAFVYNYQFTTRRAIFIPSLGVLHAFACTRVSAASNAIQLCRREDELHANSSDHRRVTTSSTGHLHSGQDITETHRMAEEETIVEICILLLVAGGLIASYGYPVASCRSYLLVGSVLASGAGMTGRASLPYLVQASSHVFQSMMVQKP